MLKHILLKANAEELLAIKAHLENVCSSQFSFMVHFNHYGSFLANHKYTFYIAPNADGKLKLKKLMKSVGYNFKAKELYKLEEPHISIGRKLSQADFEVARNSFKEIAMSFKCDRVVLRVLNEKVKQFEIVDEFYFNTIDDENKTHQLTLF